MGVQNKPLTNGRSFRADTKTACRVGGSLLVGLLLTEGALADAVAKASGLDGVTSPHSAVTALDKVLGASTSTTLASENVVVQTFAQEETAEDADDKEVDEEIIATGTRLKNSAFAGVSPVQVLTPEISQLSGSFEASDLIRSTSLATGSFQLNQQLGAVAPGGSVGNGGGGVNGISLRGLGTNRTLVVLDGRRLSPAGVQGSVGAVDLNTLPSSALARVEIVKDGSSSVYGADAVAGVINGITKKNYDGGSVDFSVNVPTEGEGERLSISADYGLTFDKGWVSFAGEYSETKRLTNSDRDFLSCSEELVFNPTTGERADIRAVDGSFKCRNHNPNGAFFSADFFGGTFEPDPTGALAGLVGNDTTAFLPGFARVGNFTLADSADEAASYAVRTEDSVAYQNADAISPLERLTLFTQGEYQLSDNTTFYGSFLYSNRQSNFNSWMFLFQNMSGDNPNNTVAQGLRDAATAAGGSSTGGIQFQVVRPINQSQEIDYFQTVAGLKGDFEGGFLDGWSWDTFISYGKSDGEYEQDFLYEDRLNAISLGTVACDASRLISDVSPAGTCDGINIDVLSTRFLVDQDWTAQETAFLEGRERGTTTYEQMVAEGTLSGSLFALPAGTVDAVFGVSYRREEIDDNPGPNAVRNNFHLFSSSGRTAGSETVREVFAEVGIPLLANQSFAESVSMVASARYTDYTISGSEETYKLGLNWTFDENIALRASYGTSFRGPNLFELFLANQESFNFLSDPCREYANSSNAQFASNCASLGIPDDFIPNVQDTLVTSGGAILPDGTTTIRPETSESWSTGLILTPGDSGISLAIEYFEIDVIDQIDVLGAQQIVNQCYGDVNFPNSSFCQLLTRNSGNVANPFILTGVNDRFLNIDLQRNRGIDYQLNYAGEIGGFEVSAGAQYTYQLEDQVTRVIDGVVDVEQLLGDPNEPQDSGSVDILLKRDGWSFFYETRFLGSSGLTEEFGGNTFNFFNGHNGQSLSEQLETGTTLYHNLSVSKDFDSGLKATLGINNVTDEKPPVVSVDWRFDGLRTGVAAQNSWDIRGRSVFLNINKKF